MKKETYLIRLATNSDYTALNRVWEKGDAMHREALPKLFQAPNGPSQERAKVEEFIAGRTAQYLLPNQIAILWA
jgi:hypothetical protein